MQYLLLQLYLTTHRRQCNHSARIIVGQFALHYLSLSLFTSIYLFTTLLFFITAVEVMLPAQILAKHCCNPPVAAQIRQCVWWWRVSAKQNEKPMQVCVCACQVTDRQYDGGVKYAEQVCCDKNTRSQNDRRRHVQFSCATMSHNENLLFFFCCRTTCQSRISWTHFKRSVMFRHLGDERLQN